jgi:hypothetical protein
MHSCEDSAGDQSETLVAGVKKPESGSPMKYLAQYLLLANERIRYDLDKAKHAERGDALALPPRALN